MGQSAKEEATASKAAVEDLSLAWKNAFNAGDAAAVAALYSEDAVLSAPGARALRGRTAIGEYFISTIAQFSAAGLTVEDSPLGNSVASGDLAWQWKTYTVTDRSGSVVDAGKLVTLFRRQDGKWLIAGDTWNSDGTATAAGSQIKHRVRRIVTGHDAHGRSVVVSDVTPPQHHSMHGEAIGAEFIEIWNSPVTVPQLTAAEAREPNEREFTIMPACGHLLRIIDVYPMRAGGKRTVMHRTQTLDYVVMIEGELVLLLEDREVTLKPGDVVVQRGTNHAWENRSDDVARAAFFHIDARFSEELLAKLPRPLDLMR